MFGAIINKQITSEKQKNANNMTLNRLWREHLFLVLSWNKSVLPCLTSARNVQPTPVFLPEEFHGWRSLVGYGPWGLKESHMIEQLTEECI